MRLFYIFYLVVFILGSSSTFKPRAVEWQCEKIYHFGTVEYGTVSGTSFKFKNISDKPVLLQTVRTTCGCTAAQWTETPVAPGETGDIRIEYSADQKGGFKKKIRVFFDAMKKPEILWIDGVAE